MNMDSVLLFLERRIRHYEQDAKFYDRAAVPKDFPDSEHYRIHATICQRVADEFRWFHQQLSQEQQPPTEEYYTTSIAREMDGFLRDMMRGVEWKAEERASTLTKLQTEIGAQAASSALGKLHVELHRLADAHKVKLEH